MTLPYIKFQSVWSAKAADETVQLDSEFSKCATKVIEIKTAAFSGTLNIKGRITGQSSFVNIPFVQIGKAAAQSASVAALSWTTNTTDSVQYVIAEPYAEIQLVMTRTAGSITLQAYGMQQPFASDGGGGGGAVALTPIAVGTISVTPTASTALTLTTEKHGVFMNDGSDDVMWRPDTTAPTATTGIPLYAGQPLEFLDPRFDYATILSQIRFIAKNGGTATIPYALFS